MNFTLKISGPRGTVQKSMSDQNLPLVLGRGVEADWVVEDDKFSRRHLRIELRGSDIWIVDLESSNGTFGRRDEKIDQRRISSGDEFRVGQHHLRFDFAEARQRSNRPQVQTRRKKISTAQLATAGGFCFWSLVLWFVPSLGDRVQIVMSTGLYFAGLCLPLLLIAVIARITHREWNLSAPAKVLVPWLFWMTGVAMCHRALEFYFGFEHLGVWVLGLLATLVNALCFVGFLFAPWPHQRRFKMSVLGTFWLVAIGVSVAARKSRPYQRVQWPELSQMVASSSFFDREPTSTSHELAGELRAQIQKVPK